jgi:hypothetical protein
MSLLLLMCISYKTKMCHCESVLSAQRLGDLLVDAVDVLGTPEFFVTHLAGLPEFARLDPALWESAYRVIALTADALFTCPRHSSTKKAG